jgi:hypothetical protein
MVVVETREQEFIDARGTAHIGRQIVREEKACEPCADEARAKTASVEGVFSDA